MFNLPFFTKKTFTIRPVVLVVLDGLGIAPPSEGNAITLAKNPNYKSYLARFPNSQLIASGEDVGLPSGEVGNTEVGHLTLGAGRTILQDLRRIDLAIEKGSFYNNKWLLAASDHAVGNHSKLHIMGLVGLGNVHSSLNHLFALLQFCKKEGLKDVYLHLFTDGRDSPPRSGINTVSEIEEHLKVIRFGKIASITGRYYAMDRDRRWDRTEKTYKALVLAQGIQVMSAVDAVKSAYARGQTDEFIQPTLVADKNGPLATIGDGDAAIFFNYRIDRPRQLTMAFTLPDFEKIKSFNFGSDPDTNIDEGEIKIASTFQREKVLKNLFFLSMTQYHPKIPVSAVAFVPEPVINNLTSVLSMNGLKQLHMAESEKERFVTYYFDGLNEDRLPNEDVVIIPSPKVSTYDKKPEMSLQKLVTEMCSKIKRDIYHFAIVNFANCDMVAHTGDIAATIKAVETVDVYLKMLVDTVLNQNGWVFVTADHGNAEELLTYPKAAYFITTSKGTVNTEHSGNPVPLIAISKELENGRAKLENGSLADVASTILATLGIQKPPEMTGKNLLVQVKPQAAVGLEVNN